MRRVKVRTKRGDRAITAIAIHGFPRLVNIPEHAGKKWWQNLRQELGTTTPNLYTTALALFDSVAIASSGSGVAEAPSSLDEFPELDLDIAGGDGHTTEDDPELANQNSVPKPLLPSSMNRSPSYSHDTIGPETKALWIGLFLATHLPNHPSDTGKEPDDRRKTS
jgi:hypothetical protein